MIEARELRIGNFVKAYVSYVPKEYIDTLDAIEIVELDRSTVTFNSKPDQNNNTALVSIDYEYLIPIPLTEVWLSKLGINQLSYHRREVPTHFDDRIFYEISLTIDDIEFIIKSQSLLEIKYVHQLQNLYFALLGEELTVNQLQKT